LPTTKPVPGQATYVIDPSIVSITPVASFRVVPYVLAGGQNLSGASVVISYEYLRNGVVVASGVSSSIPNGQYWSFVHMKETYSWQSSFGDSLELRMYASASGVTLDLNLFFVYPTRIDFGIGSNAFIKDFSYQYTSMSNSVTTTNPYNSNMKMLANWTGALFNYPTTNTSNTITLQMPTPGTTIPIMCQHSIYKAFETQGGIIFTVSGFTNNASQISFAQPNFLISATYRVVSII
jgi:hypothetical protein